MASAITPVTPYSPTTWVNGSTPINAANLNKIENGISAVSSSQLGGTTIAFQDGNFYITDKDGTKTKKLGSSEGTATTAQVLSGATFNSKNTPDSDDYSTGTMSDFSSNVQTVTPSGGTGNETIDISDGYHTQIIVNRTNPYNAGYNAGTPSAVSVAADGSVTVTRGNNTTWGGSTSNSYNNGYNAGYSAGKTAAHSWSSCDSGTGWFVSNSFTMPVTGDITWFGFVHDNTSNQCYTRLYISGTLYRNEAPGGSATNIYTGSYHVAAGTTVKVESSCYGGYGATSCVIYPTS